jgi:hypothetical protein
VSPEDRAKAVVAYFPAIPEKVRRQLQEIIARAIKRAVNKQLAQLEIKADELMEQAHGRGKSGRGRDDSAIKCPRAVGRSVSEDAEWGLIDRRQLKPPGVDGLVPAATF